MKNTFFALFGFIVLSIGIALVLQIYILRNQTALYHSQINRHSSYLLGNQLSIANSNLTKFCTRYVITGDSTWKNRYYELLKIREGQIPINSGWTQSLQDSMKSLGFTEYEFELLHESVTVAKRLVDTEKLAFDIADGISSDNSIINHATSNKNLALQLLNSEEYYIGKKAVQNTIKEFESNIKSRTKNTTLNLAQKGYRFLVLMIIVLSLVIIIAIVSYLLIKKRLLKQEEQELEIKERNKELNCLYKASQLSDETPHNIAHILSKLTKIIPEGYYTPDNTLCQIIFNENVYGDELDDSYTSLHTSNLSIENESFGEIKIYTNKPNRDASNSTSYEQELLDSIARNIVSSYDRILRTEALAKSEQRLQYAFKVSNEGIWEWSTTEDVSYSPRCFKLLGYEPSDMKKGDEVFWLSKVHPNDKEISLFTQLNVVTEIGTYNNIIRIKDAQNQYKWIHIKGEAVEKENDASIKKIVGTFADITERMKQEENVINAILETEDKERSRISREIHDGLQQTMSTSLLSFERVRATSTFDDTEAEEKFKIGYNYLKKSIEESRTLAHKLMPKVIDEQGLSQAIESLVEALQGSSDIQFNYHHNIETFKTRLASEMTLYRITQEAINNVIKYSDATICTIQLYQHTELLELSIEDNGKGFDLLNTEKSFGLNSMKTRAESIGAYFQINSQANKGTQIIVELPIK